MTTSDPADSEDGAGESSRRGSLGGAFVTTIGASAGAILLSFVTGVLTARYLGTDGRGIFAAVSSWTLTLSWASALGFANSMIYLRSVQAARSSTIVATALASIPVLGALGIVVAQLIVPFGFSAQSENAQMVARIFLCAIPLVLGTETVWALLMASHRFTFLGVLRLLQPALYLVGLVVLLAADLFTPSTVLGAQALSYGVTLVVGASLILAATGVSWPSMRLSRRGLGYGLRLQGVTLGHLITGRLDMMMLPAFVGAASLGYYSIAVNVSSMVVSLFGSLRMVVFPMAAASGSVDLTVIGRGLRATFFGGLLTVITLALVAPWLITTVYGDEFAPSVLPLWLMLPGVLLWACTMVVGAGLEALGRPGLASLAQLVGALTTIAGLAWTLPRYGILGAAGTVSVAYTLTFVAACLVLQHAAAFPLRSIVNVRELGTDVRIIGRQLTKRLARGRGKDG